MDLFIAFLVLVIIGAGALYGYRAGRWVVPPDHVGIIRRIYGRPHPDSRFARMKISPYDGSRGVQARILIANHPTWLFPGLYAVEFVPRVHIPAGMIGLVTAKEGHKRPPDRQFGRFVESDNFQDGQAFLLNGGEEGVQLPLLPGDASYYINTMLFEVQTVPRTYVPAGSVGLVIAKAGTVRAPDEPFGRHVECNNYQDGDAFLRKGGEQGKQLAILAGGTYYDIHHGLFEVITTETVNSSHDGLTPGHLKEIAIPVGYVGVVITLDGAEPPRGGTGVGPAVAAVHRSFRLPWVFLAGGGRRGVQEQTLGEGAVYSLNPWFVRVMLVPTRLLILNWSRVADLKAGNYDAELEQIVITVQGHRLHVDMSQTLQIPETAAPKLVSQFGGTQMSGLGGLVNDPVPVQRFVERVLGDTVAGYFSAIAGAGTVEELLSQYASTRTDLAAQVREALEKWGVKAVGTTLGAFESEDPAFNESLKRIFDEETRGRVLAVERENVLHEDAIDKVRVRAEQRRVGMELRAEIDALGPENAALIRMIREISNMNVPQYMGGDVSAYMEALPMPVLKDLISRMRQLRTAGEVAAGPDQKSVERSEEPEALEAAVVEDEDGRG
jgi:hypothetical protein